MSAAPRPTTAPAVAWPTPLLAAPTPAAWYERAAAGLDDLLLDHANCEKKAASTALSLLFAYAEHADFAHSLSRLAREELRHFEQVQALMVARGIRHRRLKPSRYAEGLRAAVAGHEPLRLIDLCLVGALIEARSCERFAGLAACLPSDVARFYAGLEAAERRHAAGYLAFAARFADAAAVPVLPRLERLRGIEAELVTSPDRDLRFHSGAPA